MTPSATWTTAGRVLAQTLHDPRTIALLLAVPSLLIGPVAWIFTKTDVFNTIGPAIIAIFPFIVMFLVASISTLRERRSGTLERLLTRPLSKGSFAHTEFQAVQFMPAFVFPQILLGGLFLPRDQLPNILETIGDWLPLSHAMDALTAVATGDEDSSYIVVRILFIGTWIIGSVVWESTTLCRRTP